MKSNRRKASLEEVSCAEPLEGDDASELLDTNTKPRRKHGGAVALSEGGMAKARHDRPRKRRDSGGAMWGGEGRTARQIFKGQPLFGRDEDERTTDAVLEARKNAKNAMPSLRKNGDQPTVTDDEQLRKSGGGTKWIAGAVKHPGAFTAQAEKAGKSVPAMAQSHKNDSGTLGKRARLALTFEKMAKK